MSGNQSNQGPWARWERCELQPHHEPVRFRHGHPRGLRIMAVFRSATSKAPVRFRQSAPMRGWSSRRGPLASNQMRQVRLLHSAPVLQVSSSGRTPASNPGNVRSTRTTCATHRSSNGRRPGSHPGNGGFNSPTVHHCSLRLAARMPVFQSGDAGSIPAASTIPLSSNGRIPAFDSGDGGSSPPEGTSLTSGPTQTQTPSSLSSTQRQKPICSPL